MFYKLESLDEESKFLDPQNPYEVPLLFENLEYKTIWHFFFAMKTKENRNEILNLPVDVLQQYTLSYNPKFSIREDWGKVQIPVMDFALRHYFSIESNKIKLLSLVRIPKIYDVKCNSFWFKNPIGEGENWYFKLVQNIKDDLTKGIDIQKVTFKNNEALLSDYKDFFLYRSNFEKEAIAVNKRKEHCDEYVGRGSDYGNPYPVYNGEYELEDSLRLHAVLISENAYLDKKFRAKLLKLKGKKLGCFCCGFVTNDERYFTHSPECHAQTMANLINTLT